MAPPQLPVIGTSVVAPGRAPAMTALPRPGTLPFGAAVWASPWQSAYSAGRPASNAMAAAWMAPLTPGQAVLYDATAAQAELMMQAGGDGRVQDVAAGGQGMFAAGTRGEMPYNVSGGLMMMAGVGGGGGGISEVWGASGMGGSGAAGGAGGGDDDGSGGISAASRALLGELASPAVNSRAQPQLRDKLIGLMRSGIEGDETAIAAIRELSVAGLPFSAMAGALIEHQGFLSDMSMMKDAGVFLELSLSFIFGKLAVAYVYGDSGRDNAALRQMADALEGPLELTAIIFRSHFVESATVNTRPILEWVGHFIDAHAQSAVYSLNSGTVDRNTLERALAADFSTSDLNVNRHLLGVYLELADDAAERGVTLDFTRPPDDLHFGATSREGAIKVASRFGFLLRSIIRLAMDYPTEGAHSVSVRYNYDTAAERYDVVIDAKGAAIPLPSPEDNAQAANRNAARAGMEMQALGLLGDDPSSSLVDIHAGDQGFTFTLHLPDGLIQRVRPPLNLWDEIAQVLAPFPTLLIDVRHPRVRRLSNAMAEVVLFGLRAASDPYQGAETLAAVDPAAAPWVAATRPHDGLFRALLSSGADPVAFAGAVDGFFASRIESVQAMGTGAAPPAIRRVVSDAILGPVAVIDALFHRVLAVGFNTDTILVEIVGHNHIGRGETTLTYLATMPVDDRRPVMPKPKGKLALRVQDKLKVIIGAARLDGIEFDIDIPADVGLAAGVNVQAFLSVLWELAFNAFKYHGPTRGRIAIRWNDARQSFSVIDDGIGIADVARVWEDGFRELARHSRRMQGDGHGLAIVKHDVENVLHWTISLSSTVGRGTEFTITPREGDIVAVDP